MKVLLVDNFDSFTYNLYHYLEEAGCETTVLRNDEIRLEELADFDKIVLSPGPGLPQDAGMLMQVIASCYGTKSILGVCLGMQALGLFFGDELYNMKEVKHGLSEEMTQLENCALFEHVPLTSQVGLYHSWALKLQDNSPLVATAYSENKVLMAVKHRHLPIYGFQFHPESILTEFGKEMIKSFVLD